MKKFSLHIALAVIPISIVLIAIYVIVDPYLLFHDDVLYDVSHKRKCVNSAYQAIRTMDYFSNSVHYDAFILGSSRSGFYFVADWKCHIGEDVVAMHFDQSSDNLLGTVQRTRYILQRYPDCRFLLFVMDRESLSQTNIETGHLYRQPWQVVGWWDWLPFHLSHIKAFYSVKNLAGRTPIFDTDSVIPIAHELHKDAVDRRIDSDTLAYRLSNSGNSGYAFYARPSTEIVGEPIIGKVQLVLLQELQNLLATHPSIDYRIVIGPLFDQRKLNPADFAVLQSFFDTHVYDFSGKNKITDCVANYYESSHYRPRVCKQIMDSVYLDK